MSFASQGPEQQGPVITLPGLYGVEFDNVVEIDTDPAFMRHLAKCEECDWRPPDLGSRPEVACQAHTAQTGHMTVAVLAEYVYYTREEEPEDDDA